MPQKSQEEMLKVMAEKRMALDMIEGYALIFPCIFLTHACGLFVALWLLSNITSEVC
jgi:hypothetical protein